MLKGVNKNLPAMYTGRLTEVDKHQTNITIIYKMVRFLAL
jgi:hypothetical protein